MKTNFAIFIMVYGRPEKMWTAKALRKAGYTGKIYYIADTSDTKLDGYKKKYGEDLVVFDKLEVAEGMDAGDNSGDLRSTLYAANTSFSIAKEKGLKHFMLMCDDYSEFSYMFDKRGAFKRKSIRNMDKVIESFIKYFESVPRMKTIAFAQAGDFCGGRESNKAMPMLMRKAMNSFLCSVERPLKFMGRLNEDVTTYVNLGGKGELFLTATNIGLVQKAHQQEKSGLTDVYLDNGTYIKSFFTVMYNPSCVKVGTLGTKHFRIHHSVRWNNAVPKILDESHKK